MIRKFPRELREGDIFKESETGREYICTQAKIIIITRNHKVLKVMKKKVRPNQMFAITRCVDLSPYPYYTTRGVSGGYYPSIHAAESKPKVIFHQKFWLIDKSGHLRIGHARQLTYIKHEES